MTRAPIDAEFWGYARVFVARAEAAAIAGAPLVKKVVQDAMTYYGGLRGGRPRPDFVTDIETRWLALPSAGRLDVAVARGLGKRTITLTEHRLTGSIAADPNWGSGTEGAVCIVRTVLNLYPKGVRYSGDIVGSVCAHALAQFYVRSFSTADEALMAELKRLADAAPALIPGGDEFTVPSALGQKGWAGHVRVMKSPHGTEAPALSVRTFI